MATHSSLFRPPQVRASQVRRVVRVAAGNALEMYDFQIFGYYATAIAATFFPSGNEFASLMLSLATFGAGFLMRPVGAIVLGAYIDHRGRRAGLLVTLTLMGFGTLAVACLPGYVVIGLAAPLLVLVGRLVQGFSAGVELGGVSVYLSEIAPRKPQGSLRSVAIRQPASGSDVRRVARIVLTSSLSNGQIRSLDGASRCWLVAPAALRCSSCGDRFKRPASFWRGPATPPRLKSRDRWPRTGGLWCSG